MMTSDGSWPRRNESVFLGMRIDVREEGLFTDTEIAQMFTNGRVDRKTACNPSDRGE